LAQLAFPFPQGTSPAITLSDDSVLKTSNGFDIAVTQHGVGCAQVRIRSGGKLFHSKYLYEVDTIEDDRESRKQGCLATAAEVFGEDAVDNGLVNIQIKHNAGEYIELDPDSLLNSGERYTVFLKGSMGGGKSYLVNNKVAGPILKQGGSALFVAPNISLVDSMVAECARSGVPMTSYQKRKKKRNRAEPQDSSEPPRKKTKLDQWLTPSDDSQLSGDYEFKASTATAKFDEDALITTFDSLGQAENCKPDLIFIDETSKVLLQFTSATMDKAAFRRTANLDKMNELVKGSKIVICADADLTHDEVAYVQRKRMDDSKTIRVLYHNSHYRLDARLVPTLKQLQGNILRSVIVEKKNTVVACSTNDSGVKQLPELFKRYAFGKVDLFLNKVERTRM